MREKVDLITQFIDFAFNVCNVALFSICQKVLTVLHPDIPCIARSKQHICSPNSEVNRCIGAYIFHRLWHQFRTKLHRRM